MVNEIFGLVAAIFLGALIGLQREFKQQHETLKSFAGFRSFILISFFGGLLGYLSGSFSSLWVSLGFIFVLVLSILAYFLLFKKLKIVSGTTEISFVFTYVLGVMCTTGYVELAVIVGILIVTFLTFKERLHKLAKKLKSKELIGMIKFALIAFVILPFLPNKNYSLLDIPGVGAILQGLGINFNFLSQLDVFNFYKIWLMVIFIAGINLVGYFLIKLIGKKKGYGVLGFVGGLVSSTAVTLSVAGESKKNKKIMNAFIIAILLAGLVMFVRVLFEVAIVNASLLSILIFPLGIMALISFLIVFFLYKRKEKVEISEDIEVKQPFALKPALIFGLFFGLILFVSKLAQLLFGSVGIYMTSVLSGFIDVNAITLTMASLSKTGSVNNFVAGVSIMLAVLANTLFKAGLVYFLGNRKLGKTICLWSILILFSGLLALFLF